MTCNTKCTQFDLAIKLLIENRCEQTAEVVGLLMITAMKLEGLGDLNACFYERQTDKMGFANGYKATTIKTHFD